MNSREGLVDALPYIDQGYEEDGIRESVFYLIEEETKRYKPTKNYLEHLGDIELNKFETQAMKNEIERIENQKPMEMLNMKRYELPAPPPGKQNEISAWNDAINNSYAQLEHQNTRILNLKIMNTYGGESWKTFNTFLNTKFTRNSKKITRYKTSNSRN